MSRTKLNAISTVEEEATSIIELLASGAILCAVGHSHLQRINGH